MPQRRKQDLATIVQDQEMLATPLLILCIDAFGTEFFDWEPDTFEIEATAAFGVAIPNANRDKIWALVTALTASSFYVSLETFMAIGNALNDSESNFQYYDPLDGEEAAWAIAEVLMHEPPTKDEDLRERFSHEIRRFIALTLQSEGVTTPPRTLAMFAEFDKDPEGNVGAVLGPDPAFMQMHEARQAKERKEIDNYVYQRMMMLIQQVQMLPLAHGSTAQLEPYLQQAQKLVSSLPTPQVEGPSPRAVL